MCSLRLVLHDLLSMFCLIHRCGCVFLPLRWDLFGKDSAQHTETDKMELTEVQNSQWNGVNDQCPLIKVCILGCLLYRLLLINTLIRYSCCAIYRLRWPLLQGKDLCSQHRGVVFEGNFPKRGVGDSSEFSMVIFPNSTLINRLV